MGNTIGGNGRGLILAVMLASLFTPLSSLSLALSVFIFVDIAATAAASAPTFPTLADVIHAKTKHARILISLFLFSISLSLSVSLSLQVDKILLERRALEARLQKLQREEERLRQLAQVRAVVFVCVRACVFLFGMCWRLFVYSCVRRRPQAAAVLQNTRSHAG